MRVTVLFKSIGRSPIYLKGYIESIKLAIIAEQQLIVKSPGSAGILPASSTR